MLPPLARPVVVVDGDHCLSADGHKSNLALSPKWSGGPEKSKTAVQFFSKTSKTFHQKNLRGVATGASQKCITAAIDTVR